MFHCTVEIRFATVRTEWVKSRYTEDTILHTVYLLLAHSVYSELRSRCMIALCNVFVIILFSLGVGRDANNPSLLKNSVQKYSHAGCLL